MEGIAAVKAEADRAAGNVLPIIAEIRKCLGNDPSRHFQRPQRRGVPTPRRGAGAIILPKRLGAGLNDAVSAAGQPRVGGQGAFDANAAIR